MLAAVDMAALEMALASSSSFPGGASRLRQLGAGFYSFVFRTHSGWIVRVTRTADAAERHAREAVVLPHVAARLPVAVPLPFEALASCPAALFGAFAYRELPGRVMSQADSAGSAGEGIAGQLGRALAALHAVPADPIPDGIPVADPGHLAELYVAVMPALRPRLSADEYTTVSDWWLSLLKSDIPAWPLRTLVHGDPWFENLTVDASGLTGILDWEFLSWSDPANDLGVTLEMGEQFFRATLAAYESSSARDDPTLEARARKLFGSRVFYGVKFAIDRDDEAEWENSLAKLRAGPILGG